MRPGWVRRRTATAIATDHIHRLASAGPSASDQAARRAGLLPAITFIFSRAGCDAAVEQCLHAGLWLTDAEERSEITAMVEAAYGRRSPSEDLDVLGLLGWLDGLGAVVAAHHAGMVPAFKEIVEALFVRGLVKAVFATETLALGINMPARRVVLERLTQVQRRDSCRPDAG